MNFSNIYRPFDNKDEEYGLLNPSSKATFFILWLYQIEPPFYFHLNEASRRQDRTLLPMLGPFARAIHHILNGADHYKSQQQLERGDQLHRPDLNLRAPLGFMCRSFVLFRGVSLQSSDIQLWTSQIGKRMYDDK